MGLNNRHQCGLSVLRPRWVTGSRLRKRQAPRASRRKTRPAQSRSIISSPVRARAATASCPARSGEDPIRRCRKRRMCHAKPGLSLIFHSNGLRSPATTILTTGSDDDAGRKTDTSHPARPHAQEGRDLRSAMSAQYGTASGPPVAQPWFRFCPGAAAGRKRRSPDVQHACA